MALQTDPFTVQAVLDQPLGWQRPTAYPRCLCRFDDGSVFAYAEHGKEFVRASDRELWAVERDDTLVSARSGSVLAQRRGRVYFEPDDETPLYYERVF
jgi:hypothetical protein